MKISKGMDHVNVNQENDHHSFGFETIKTSMWQSNISKP
jgi:hypothetical protein